MIDGIDHLVALYGDQETFVEAFVAHTLFFPVALVEQRNVAMIDLYRTGAKFSAMGYSTKRCYISSNCNYSGTRGLSLSKPGLPFDKLRGRLNSYLEFKNSRLAEVTIHSAQELLQAETT